MEGGEGVGKSSFLAALARELEARGVPLEQGREPGGTPGADRIRQLFAEPSAGEPWLAMTELCLVSAARAQHVGVRIRPALAAGRWFLCDRYADSSRVYQGVLGGLPRDAVEAIVGASTGGLTPDLTFLLDCDVAVAQERIAADERRRAAGAAPVTRYDEAARSVHEALRRAFLALAAESPARFVVLDASRPTAASVAQALRAIEERNLGA